MQPRLLTPPRALRNPLPSASVQSAGPARRHYTAIFPVSLQFFHDNAARDEPSRAPLFIFVPVFGFLFGLFLPRTDKSIVSL